MTQQKSAAEPAEKKQPDKTGGDKAEAKVETGRVSLKNLTAEVNSSGTIQPKRKVDVSANAMGTIVHLAVVEGQTVQEGDLLMEIDPSEYRSSVQALEAAISSARAELDLALASRGKGKKAADGKAFRKIVQGNAQHQ